MPGFSDAVQDSLRTFRAIMDAMAHPGRRIELPVLPQAPAPLYATTAAVCLTLLDMDTPLWIDGPVASPDVLEYLKFHCGCAVTKDAGEASFAVLGEGSLPSEWSAFAVGDPLYPHRSATVIIQVQSLDNLSMRGVGLRGPGIEEEIRVHAGGLSEAFWGVLRANGEQFPQGVDVLLTSTKAVCGLPRTVRVILSAAD